MSDAIGSVTAAMAVAGGTTGAAPAAAPAAQPDPPATVPDLSELAAALNQHAQSLQTSLHFRVDQITGQLVISVVDTKDNQLLLQVPGQEALAIAQSLERVRLQLMQRQA